MQSPMLASEMDLGMAVTLKDVTDITSAAQQNRLWMGITCNGLTGIGSAIGTTKHKVTCWHLKMNLGMNVTLDAGSDVGCATLRHLLTGTCWAPWIQCVTGHGLCSMKVGIIANSVINISSAQKYA